MEEKLYFCEYKFISNYQLSYVIMLNAIPQNESETKKLVSWKEERQAGR